MKEGIDVSVYQGLIDWGKVKTDFAYIKMDQGVGSIDANCKINALACQGHAIPFGYYHFASLNKPDHLKDSADEVRAVINHLAGLPKAKLIFALDVETNEVNLSPDQVEAWIDNFVTGMSLNGYKVMLYSGCYWLNTNLKKDHGLGQIPLWLAEYTNIETPILPNGWKDYAIWQWNCKGRMLGIPGDVDLNRAKTLIDA